MRQDWVRQRRGFRDNRFFPHAPQNLAKKLGIIKIEPFDLNIVEIKILTTEGI